MTNEINVQNIVKSPHEISIQQIIHVHNELCAKETISEGERELMAVCEVVLLAAGAICYRDEPFGDLESDATH